MSWFDELTDDDAPAAPGFGGVTDTADDPARVGAAAGAGEPAEGAGESDESVVADDFGEFGVSEEWTPEQGFGDPLNVVRVWSDADGGLGRIRFSLSWRARLGDRALGEAVTTAFMLMNNYLHSYGSPLFEDDLPAVVREPSPERVAQIKRRWAVIEEELAGLNPVEFPGYREVWTPAFGTDFDDGVGVWLDRAGRASIARFDESWLRSARSRELAVGVMASYRRARAAYRPPVRTLDRRGELLAEQRRLLHELCGPVKPVVRELGADLALPAPPGVLGRRPPAQSSGVALDTGNED